MVRDALALKSEPVDADRARPLLGLVVGALAVVSLAVLPKVSDRSDLLNLLFLVYLAVSLGQSWNILGGFAGQVNLGHAAFFGVGALVARTLWIGQGQPFALAFVAGGLAAVLFAMLIGVPTFRLRGVYFAIGTLGMAEVLRITTANTLPLVSAMPAELAASYDLTARYELALGLAAATMLTAWLLLRSRAGLGLLAVREDEVAAEATGVEALRHKLLALGLSALFAGLAGATFAYYHVSYYPEFAFSTQWTFDAVLITFVGGVGTLAGPLIGAIFYVFIREQLAISLVQVHQVIFGLLFIAIVLVLPGGLVDTWARAGRWLRRR
jgi:branched-chain amino acid transport system permease protein